MVRLSLATSLIASASPRWARSPMMPSPSVDRVGHDGRREASPWPRTGRKTWPSSSARKMALVSAVSSVERAIGHPLEDRAEVEHGGDLGGHLRQGRHLARLALRIAVEAGVLDGDADVRRERGEQALVRLAEATAARSCPGR